MGIRERLFYFSEYFLRRHVECNRTQVDVHDRVHARQNEKQTRSFRAARQDATQTQYHSSFVFFHDLKREKILFFLESADVSGFFGSLKA